MALVGQGQLRFDAIEADGSELLLRRYGSTAIVVGRTEDAWQLRWGALPGEEPLYPRVRGGPGSLAPGLFAGHADRR